MMTTTFRLINVGDTVFVPVTDHPDFPRKTHEGDGAYFSTRAAAENIAAMWNSYYGGQWPWRVEERVLQPKRTAADEQDGLFR